MKQLFQPKQKPVLPISRIPSIARQRGASLLEGIAYLGIAAVVVLGAVSLLGGAFSSAKSNQAIEEAVAMRTAVRKLYIGQSYPAASLVPSMIAANAIPGTLAKNTTDNTLKNSWGGAVTVTGTATGFEISYASIPQDVCVNLLTGASGWVEISQGSKSITVFPVSVGDATAACSVAGAAGNAITFKGA
ncbi:type 4 pilus major pilin [Pseudoduganella violaceinigra]|uniref:type 4 pilus major pilin n=1 Tax=Pseudoduganella violaceinigra TaxID=246602 RepID=UPI00040363FB|nr:type 4 pilus major pilin [Pseudoduganella violaceinigra]